jgi:putative peptidoglycan lipid II flippase
MFRKLLSVGGFTLLSRVMGFFRSIVTAAVLGDSVWSDAFQVALRLPNSFRSIFAEGSFNAAFVPRYSALRATKGEGAAAEFANRIFSWQMAAQVLLLVLALLGMPWIVGVMAGGFHVPGETELATALSRITFPYLILTVVAVQLSAMLNSRERFWAAAAWPIFLNLGIIGALLLVRWFPNAAYAAAWGVLAAGVLQLIFIVWAAARDHVHLMPGRPRWGPQEKSFLKALGAGTIGSASVQIGLFVDTLIASYLAVGVLTAVTYADNIDQLPLGTIAIALGTILLPEMSRRLAQGDEVGAHKAQNDAAALTLFLTLPFAVSFLLVPQTIMRGVFVRGHFSIAAADISASALAGYGIGLPAFVLLRVMQSTFYARHDMATPMRGTLLSIAVNIVMKLILVLGLHLGAFGIALGLSLGTWANIVMLAWLGTRRGLLRLDKRFARALPAIVLAALATGGAALGGALLGNHWLAGAKLEQEGTLAVAVLSGGLAYGLVTLLFRRSLPLGRLAR